MTNLASAPKTIYLDGGRFIPPMSDPLGRYWEQPDPSGWLFDRTHVLMPRRDFFQLETYSTTVPSGMYAGKLWKAERLEPGPDFPNPMRGTGEYELRWFYPVDDPNRIGIGSLRILTD